MAPQTQNMRAGATINVARILIASTVDANSAIQAVDGAAKPIGISANWSRANPDPAQSDATALQAALVGENIAYWPNGTPGVDLYCNFAWSPGDLIMADASGYGIVATTTNYHVGRAETAGVVGAYCPVTVDVGYTK